MICTLGYLPIVGISWGNFSCTHTVIHTGCLPALWPGPMFVGLGTSWVWVWVGLQTPGVYPCSCLLTHILALQKGDLHSVHSKHANWYCAYLLWYWYNVAHLVHRGRSKQLSQNVKAYWKKYRCQSRRNDCLSSNLWSALGRLMDVIGNASCHHYLTHSGTSLLCHHLYCLSQWSHYPHLIYFMRINSLLYTFHSSSPEVLETYFIIHPMSTFCIPDVVDMCIFLTTVTNSHLDNHDIFKFWIMDYLLDDKCWHQLQLCPCRLLVVPKVLLDILFGEFHFVLRHILPTTWTYCVQFNSISWPCHPGCPVVVVMPSRHLQPSKIILRDALGTRNTSQAY